MDKDELHETAQKQWRQMPEEMREQLREYARRAIAAQADEKGVPVEEVATPELVEEVAVGCIERLQADSMALLEEHVGPEDFERWIREEFERLYPEHPQGVPADALDTAVYARVVQERPEIWQRRGRRKQE